MPVAEQVIEVPKIFLEDILSRLSCRDPQLGEQLVEVPINRGYSLAVLASKVFSRREISGFLSGQGSTASGSELCEQNVDIPVLRGRRGGGAEVFKVLVQDRVHQHRM